MTTSYYTTYNNLEFRHSHLERIEIKKKIFRNETERNSEKDEESKERGGMESDGKGKEIQSRRVGEQTPKESGR